MSERIRVLIADDSAFVRLAVERMLAGMAGVEFVGSAADGAEAVALVHSLKPDVVVMDVNMPGMNGLEALRRIMAEHPVGVLMLSTQTKEGAETTLQALEAGAVDFLDKSSTGTVMDIYSLAPALHAKVRTVAAAVVTPSPSPAAPAEAAPDVPAELPHASTAACPYQVIVIGTSTGGPRALVEVLSRLPADFGAPVVIAQHMPSGFTATLADRLNRRSGLLVREAEDGEPLVAGRVLVGPGGKQIEVVRDQRQELRVVVSDGPAELLYRPCVDRLFESTAAAVGAGAVGVVLTGMGEDGARGLKALRSAGARTLAESQETAVIYGMPRAAAEAAERMVRIQDVASALIELCSEPDGPKKRRS